MIGENGRIVQSPASKRKVAEKKRKAELSRFASIKSVRLLRMEYMAQRTETLKGGVELIVVGDENGNVYRFTIECVGLGKAETD